MCQLSSTDCRTGSCLLNTSGHMPRSALSAPGSSNVLQGAQQIHKDGFRRILEPQVKATPYLKATLDQERSARYSIGGLVS
jgi:hypothetical protein